MPLYIRVVAYVLHVSIIITLVIDVQEEV